MKRMLFAGVSAVALLAVASIVPASAADIYRGDAAPSYKDGPALLSVAKWEGLYLGVHGGYAWGDTKATDQLASDDLPWNRLGDTFTAETDGAVAGGTLGYNFQRGNVILGLEGDIGWLQASGTGTSSLSSDTHVKSDGGLYATARGRLGYAFDRTLIFATGGYFGADLHSKVYDHQGATIDTSTAGFQSGWTVGGGLEHALSGGWSVKGEYLYYDLGRERVGGDIGGGVVQYFDIDNTGSIVRLGLTKHLNSGYDALK